MEALIKEAFNSETWCVIGATPNKERFGYKIFKRLKEEGYTVYGINPTHKEIEGVQLYSDIQSLPQSPQCASMVVSPEIGKKHIDSLYNKGVRLLWFQPNTYDDEILEQAKTKGFKCIYGRCVLVELSIK